MPTGNQYTSAQVPAALQIIDPTLVPQQNQVTRQQKLADLLRQQSLQPMSDTQVVGGWAVKRSPWEGVAKIAQAFGANYAQKDADDKQQTLSRVQQIAMAKALGGDGGQDRAATALSQGAAAQPSQPDESGALVNQGGVGPTVQNAERMDSLPQQPVNNFGMANLVKGQLIGEIGGQAAGAAYWDQFKPTEGMRSDKYLGITAEQSRASELAKRLKEGYIAPTRLGEGAYADSSGNVQALPAAAPAGYINARGADGTWSTAPVSGGVEAVQTAERAKALGKTLGTLNQGFDENNRPTYFMGVPPGAVNAPQAQAPQVQPPQRPMSPQGASPQAGAPAQAPSSGPVDLNHMTPQQSQALMAQAQAQFGLRPGSTPGTSVQGQSPTAQAPLQPQNPSPAAPPVAPAPQSNMIRPGNMPGQNEYMQATATAAGKRANDLVTTAAESPTRVNVLDNIISLSKSGVASGPNAEFFNKIKGAVSGTYDVAGWKDEVTGYQELKKYMAQNGIRAWQAAGGSGTDAQLSAAMAANPNEKMNPAAVQAMAKWSKAGEIALQGKANAAQVANINTPADQARFEASWRQNMDPRIFQMKMMDVPEAQAFVANLKKTDPRGYQTLLQKAQNLKQMGGL